MSEKAYCGEERRHLVEVHCTQEEAIKRMKSDLDSNTKTINSTHALLMELDRKLFHSNGTEALIPEIRSRLKTIELSQVPRDDLKEVVDFFKLGKKAVLWTVGVALFGFLCTLFWHLFKRVA